MKNWNIVPDMKIMEKTIKALKQNGFEATAVGIGAEAKQKFLDLIPQGAEVMNMTSITLETLGLVLEIQESGNYNSVKKELSSMDRKTQGREMQRLGATPEWAVGSVHAVTQDGHVLIASNSGSQLPAYSYGSDHVVFIVGAQKIVKNIDEGMKRIYEHSLPLESERAKKAYGVSGSFVSKILILQREPKPGRTHIILVNEVLGY